MHALFVLLYAAGGVPYADQNFVTVLLGTASFYA